MIGPVLPSPLTIGERILVHLSQYVQHYEAYVCPPEMAQSGIATCLGISRAHAAIELKRQMAAGRVTVRLAHVTGMPTRRKVYALTPPGVEIVRRVRERAFDRTVELVLPDGGAEAVPGARALEILRRHGVGEGRAVLLLLTRERIDVRAPGVRHPVPLRPHPPVRSPEMHASDAFRHAFVRPIAWQFEVVLGPPHAPPVPAAA